MPFRNLPAPAQYLLGLIASTVAIYAGGMAGLLLVVEPGFLPTFWPPAAIAIAVLLLGGSRMCPAVLVGSALVYRSLAFDLAGRFDQPAGLAVGLAVATGLTLQASVAVALIRHRLGTARLPSVPSEVLGFLALAGPVASLIEPTCGVAILRLAGLVRLQDLPTCWISWWIGNQLAVAVLLPLILVIANRSQLPWRRRLLGIALPVSIAASITAAFFAYAQHREQDGVQADFRRKADRMAAQLESHLDGHIEVLYSISSFFASSIEVDRKEFSTFLSRPFERHQGIQALEWAPRVRRENVDDWIEFAKWNGYGDLLLTERDATGKLRPVAHRAEYFPVFYLEPFPANQSAYGFDLASESKRRAAMLRARDGDRAIATERIELVQNRQSGTLVFVPLYENGKPRDTLEQRRQFLSGYAVGVLNLHEILQFTTVPSGQEGIEISLFDRSSPGTAHQMFHLPKPPAPETTQAKGYPRIDLSSFQVTNPLVVAGRKWELKFQPQRRYLANARGWRAWLVATGGFALCGLLGAFLLSASEYTSRIEETVAARTVELSAANEHLQQEVGVRRQAEEALSAQAQELERSNEELQRFAHVASHDLREPLRAVSGFCQLLKKQLEGQLDASCQTYLQHVLEGSQRMQALLDGLLAYSRVNTHGQPLQTFDSQQAFDSALANLHVAIQESGAEITRGPLPTVEADPPQLMQLFQNLLGNAIKYHRDGMPQVRVEAKYKDGAWVFSVSDNGIGIDERNRERIFVIFQRLHTRNEFAGTGIGLAVCKRIVERHGGRIWVESKSDAGSTFYFTIPGPNLRHAPAIEPQATLLAK